MPFIERPNARIYFEDAGGDGIPVLFSHGILMDHEMFSPQINALRGEAEGGSEYRCVAWDERGHGQTEDSGPFSYWDSARDAIALLDHLAIDRAVLVGMSQGGFISLRVALEAPERVRGLFLIDTQAGLEDPNVVPSYLEMAKQWAANGPQQHLAEASAALIVAPADATPWIEKWFTQPQHRVTEMMNCLVTRDDITERLREIDAPAVVVHGDADPSIPMSRAEELAAGLPRCDGVVQIAGGGHAANLSHPDEVNHELEEFLTSVSG
ncbi:MAG: alpha/beta fold hydrolase [Actinomycetota bacterium]